MIALETIPITTTRPAGPGFGASPAASSPSRPFGHLLEDLGTSIDGGERLIRNASAGNYAALDAGHLIALQAGIYRYSEAIELGAKLVDRTTSSVRAVLQAGH